MCVLVLCCAVEGVARILDLPTRRVLLVTGEYPPSGSILKTGRKLASKLAASSICTGYSEMQTADCCSTRPSPASPTQKRSKAENTEEIVE